MFNFTDGVYTGSDPLLINTFTHLATLRTLSAHVREVLRCGKSVKGTLNEATYPQRLEDNELTGKHDEIVREQYSRRLEYFRIRMLLQYCLIERLQQTLDQVLRLSGDVRQLLRAGWCPGGFNEQDYTSTLAETVTALEDTSVADLLPKARNFVEEKDETYGFGQKAFEKYWTQIPGWYGSWTLPAQYQLVMGAVQQHALDVELCQVMNEIWNTALTYERLIELAAKAHPYAYRRPTDAKPTRVELRRYLEVYHRLSHMADAGGDEWTGPILLGARETVRIMNLLEPLQAAIPAIASAPTRWLAMSNYLAALALAGHLRSLDARAHNIVFNSGSDHFRQTALQTFDAAIHAAAAANLGKSVRFPTNAYFVVREGFNPRSVSPRHLVPGRTLFQPGETYPIVTGGEREFCLRGAYLWYLFVEEGEKFGQLALTKEDADRIGASFRK